MSVSQTRLVENKGFAVLRSWLPQAPAVTRWRPRGGGLLAVNRIEQNSCEEQEVMLGERVIGPKTLNRKILNVFHQIDKAACDHEHVAGIVEIDKPPLPPGKAQFGWHVDRGHTSAAAEDFAGPTIPEGNYIRDKSMEVRL